MVKDSGARIVGNGTWADYCDALQAERWLRRLEAKRMSRSQQQKAPAVSAGNPDAIGSSRHAGDGQSS